LNLERAALAERPEEEEDELTAIYIRRGLDADLARAVCPPTHDQGRGLYAAAAVDVVVLAAARDRGRRRDDSDQPARVRLRT
jgi:hypothetical protein